jgi:hypothetical protein
MIPYTTVILPTAYIASRTYNYYKSISASNIKYSFDIVSLHASAAAGMVFDFSGITTAVYDFGESIFNKYVVKAIKPISSPKVREDLRVEEQKCLAKVFDEEDTVFIEEEVSKSFEEIGLYPAIAKECKRLDKVVVEKCQVKFFDLCSVVVKGDLIDSCCNNSNITKDLVQVCLAVDCSGQDSPMQEVEAA